MPEIQQRQGIHGDHVATAVQNELSAGRRGEFSAPTITYTPSDIFTKFLKGTLLDNLEPLLDNQ